jgi:cyclopropane fatty-acyl-phospholipid synthase-like methyltransferase
MEQIQMGPVSNTSTGASANTIQAHYDVGNEFYRLWLDDSKSCRLPTGFSRSNDIADRTNYGRTCEIWAANLKAQRTKAIDMVGQEQTRRYERYLKFSAWGFWSHRLHLLRFRMKRR